MIVLQVHPKRSSGPRYQVVRHLRNDLQRPGQLRQALGRRTDHGEHDQPGQITIQTTTGLAALIATLKSRITEQRDQRGRRTDLRGLTNLTNITPPPLVPLLPLLPLALPLPPPPPLLPPSGHRTRKGQGTDGQRRHPKTINRINVIPATMPSALFAGKFLFSKDE